MDRSRVTPVAFRWSALAAICGLLWAAASARGEPFSLRVVDERGAAVDKFEAEAFVRPDWTPEWTAGKQGKVRYIPPAGFATIDVVICAEGFASRLESFSGDKLQQWKAGTAEIVLQRGAEVELRCTLPDGGNWPRDVKPRFYFDSLRRYATGEVDMNMLRARASGPGRAIVRLSHKSPPLGARIHAPGFLQFCEVGRLTVASAKDGVLEIALPKPAELEIEFDPGATDADKRPYDGASFMVTRNMGAGQPMALAANRDVRGPRPSLKLADLAAGDYLVRVQTLTDMGRAAENDANPRFSALRPITLATGERQQLSVRFVPLDRQAFRGEHTAILRFRNFDRSPAAGQQVWVKYADPHYGALEVYGGKLPDSGVLELPNLAARHPEPAAPCQYHVHAGELVSAFTFADDAAREKFAFTLPPVSGEIAPDVELTDVASGRRLRLGELRGKVVCLDFWATWCGPCQEPIAHLRDLALDPREAWKDRVAIVPISIDDKMESVTAYLTERGWTNIDHYWTGAAEGIGWKSPAAQAFVITSVPTSVIIGRDGKILWRGNPASAGESSTEAKIEAALR